MTVEELIVELQRQHNRRLQVAVVIVQVWGETDKAHVTDVRFDGADVILEGAK
jgi:hypothetical protein